MDPSFRTLRQITIDCAWQRLIGFSMLMGDEVPPRENLLKEMFMHIDA
jgi:DNA gyrase subunit B